MNRHKQNIEIANALGFKFTKDGQVIYPVDWENERRVVPVRTIPDFVGMLEHYRKLADDFKYGIKTDFKAVKEALDGGLI